MCRPFLIAAAAAVVVAFLPSATPDAQADARGVRRGVSVFPVGSATDPRGKIQVKHWTATRTRAERSKMVIKLRKLQQGETYTLWGDDPREEIVRLNTFSPYRIGPLTGRVATVRYLSGTDAFPFESSLDELAGKILQIRNSAGDVVVASSFPALR